MGRIRQFVISRLTQAWFLQFWQEHEECEYEANLIRHMRDHCPSLFVAVTHAIKSSPRKDVGHFLAVLRKCIMVLAIFLIQQPNPEQIGEYCEELDIHVTECCPTIDTSQLKLLGLAELLLCCMTARRALNPNIARVEAALLPLRDEDARRMAAMCNASMTRKIFDMLMTSLRPAFRAELNFAQFIGVSRGFVHEERQESVMPDPEILELQIELDQEYDDDNYRPTGARIAVHRFCEVVDVVPVGSVCSICVEDVVGEAGNVDDQPVVTKCGHSFHAACLDAWVNDSGMRTANMCPSCRAEMCEGRPRVLASMLAQLDGTVEVDEMGENMLE
jgi:hypothetical protein